MVAELVAAGEITSDEATTHEQRFMLTRAIGVAPDVDVDYAAVSTAAGDRLLLCTDGLHRAVAQPDIARLAGGSGDDPQAAADELVAAALGAGTADNVSVVVVAISGSDREVLRHRSP